MKAPKVRAYPSGAVRSVSDQVAAGAVMPRPKPPKDLNTIADVILRYKPPEKQKATKQREKRRAKRAAKKG